MALPIVPLLDLTRQNEMLRPQIEKALSRVVTRGQFVLGEEVASFEREFGSACNVRHAAGVASGSDALELALRAVGVGPGDLVVTVSFTFLATVDSILHVGAAPLFVDIHPRTFTMDPEDVTRRLKLLPASARRRVKAILPVHLFGQPCDMGRILQIARDHRLLVIEDCAQAAGALWCGHPAGSLGDAGCFSFFPSKNLGAFGDGGMVVTHSASLAQRVRSLRVHGRGKRGTQLTLGRNSRLDELQAAILRVKLRSLAKWVDQRRALARAYTRSLEDLIGVRCPVEEPDTQHAFSLFVIRVAHRNKVQEKLLKSGVATGIYYPLPVHRQPVHGARFRSVHLPETERACRDVLALPLFPELKLAQVKRVCRLLKKSL